jgi:hypothetical protein
VRVRVADQDDDDENTLDADQTGWRATSGLSWRAMLGGSGASTVSVSHSVTAYDTSAWDQKLDGALASSNHSREHQLTLKHDLARQACRKPTRRPICEAGLVAIVSARARTRA